MLKKICTVLIISCVAAPVLAYENYMLMADKKVTGIKVLNEDILTLKPILSTKCEGNTMLVIPKCVGKTKISFCKGKKRVCIKVKVKQNETCIKNKNGVKFVKLDLPPELIQ